MIGNEDLALRLAPGRGLGLATGILCALSWLNGLLPFCCCPTRRPRPRCNLQQRGVAQVVVGEVLSKHSTQIGEENKKARVKSEDEFPGEFVKPRPGELCAKRPTTKCKGSFEIRALAFSSSSNLLPLAS